MADFRETDINSMRQDAIRRAREMQTRSQSYGNKANAASPVQPRQQAVQGASRPASSGQNFHQAGNQGAYSGINSSHGQRNPQPGNQGGNSSRQQQFQQTRQNASSPIRQEQSAPTRTGVPPMQNTGFHPLGFLFGGNSQQNQGASGKGPISGLLNQIFPGIGGNLEEDRIILVILMILLAREGADLKLLLALGYLLM